MKRFGNAALVSKLLRDFHALLVEPPRFGKIARDISHIAELTQGLGNSAIVSKLLRDFHALLVEPSGFGKIVLGISQIAELVERR